MEDNRFAVVFTGRLAPGVSQDQARKAAAERFKLNGAQLDKLFTGGQIIVRRDLDRATCETIVRALNSAGLVCVMGELRPRGARETPAGLGNGGRSRPPAAPVDDDGPPPPPPVSADEDDDDWPPSRPDAPAQSPSPPRLEEPDVARVVPAVLGRYGAAKGAYPLRTAPEKKLRNALIACFLNEDETVYGVLDGSTFGSCQDCLVFAADGVNFSRGKKNKGFIPYREFVDLEIQTLDKYSVLMGDNHIIGMGNVGMPAAEGVLFLKELQAELKRSMGDHGGDVSATHASGRHRERPMEMDKALAFILGQYANRERVHAFPEIPGDRAAEAYVAGQVPATEQALGLISTKVMGKYDKFLLFTDKGLHYRGGSTVRGFIPYQEFPAMEFVRGEKGELMLGTRAALDITAHFLKWFEFCSVLSAVQDYASEVLLGRQPFAEPKNPAIACKRCGSANLGAATKTKPSFAWGLVGFVVAQPLLVVSGVDTAAAVSKQFGKTEVYMACRHCGHGWREDSLTTSNLKT